MGGGPLCSSTTCPFHARVFSLFVCFSCRVAPGGGLAQTLRVTSILRLVSACALGITVRSAVRLRLRGGPGGRRFVASGLVRGRNMLVLIGCTYRMFSRRLRVRYQVLWKACESQAKGICRVLSPPPDPHRPPQLHSSQLQARMYL